MIEELFEAHKRKYLHILHVFRPVASAVWFPFKDCVTVAAGFSLGQLCHVQSMFLLFQVVVVTDYAEGELFQILEDDGNLPEEQVQNYS